jgi:hypothetical protein
MEAIALCLLLHECGLYIYRSLKSFSTTMRRTESVEVYSHPLTSTVDNDEWLT